MFRRLVHSPVLYDVLQRLAGHAALEHRLVRHFAALPRCPCIIDIGGGTGMRRAAINGSRYICLDVDEEKLRRSRRESRTRFAVRGDATACPLAGACADAVVCMKVTHHLDDRALTAAFAEMLRLVSPQGIVIVADAVASSRWLPRALWSIDRGSHVRNAEAILGALPRTASVVAREDFRLGRFHDFLLFVARRTDHITASCGSAA